METAVVETAVTNPLALTVILGICVDDPNVPTFEFTVANVEVPVTLADPLNAPDV